MKIKPSPLSGISPNTNFSPGNTETITQIVYDDTYSQIPPYDYWTQQAQKHQSRHTLVLRPKSAFPTCFVTQVDRLKTIRKKRILKPCLMQKSHSVKVLQLCFSDPFSLNSFSLTT